MDEDVAELGFVLDVPVTATVGGALFHVVFAWFRVWCLVAPTVYAIV